MKTFFNIIMACFLIISGLALIGNFYNDLQLIIEQTNSIQSLLQASVMRQMAFEEELRGMLKKMVVLEVDITAYTSVRRCTDNTPHITAFNTKTRPGIVAVSRDIEQEWGLEPGDKIIVSGMGEFVFEDRMHPKIKKTVDIWLPTEEEALEFGRKKGTIIICKG